MSVRTYILQRWVAWVGTVSPDTERDLSHLDTKEGILFLLFFFVVGHQLTSLHCIDNMLANMWAHHTHICYFTKLKITVDLVYVTWKNTD